MHPNDRQFKNLPTQLEKVLTMDDNQASNVTSVLPQNMPHMSVDILAATEPMRLTTEGQHPSTDHQIHGNDIGSIPNILQGLNRPSPATSIVLPQYPHNIATSSSIAPSFNFLTPSSYGMPQMSSPSTVAPSSKVSSNWQHTIPRAMPWANPTSALNDVVFSASSSPFIRSNSRLMKRKYHTPLMEMDPEEGVCNKQLVTEEKMSQRMQELSLDNNNMGWHTDLEANRPQATQAYPHRNGHSRDEENSEPKSANPSQTLDISNILKLGLKTREILPKAVLDTVASPPDMQVMLWKPPGNHIPDLLRHINQSKSLESNSQSALSSQMPFDNGKDAAIPGPSNSSTSMRPETSSQSQPSCSNGTTSPRTNGLVNPNVWSRASPSDDSDSDDFDLVQDNNNTIMGLMQNNNNDPGATDLNNDVDMDL